MSQERRGEKRARESEEEWAGGQVEGSERTKQGGKEGEGGQALMRRGGSATVLMRVDTSPACGAARPISAARRNSASGTPTCRQRSLTESPPNPQSRPSTAPPPAPDTEILCRSPQPSPLPQPLAPRLSNFLALRLHTPLKRRVASPHTPRPPPHRPPKPRPRVPTPEPLNVPTRRAQHAHASAGTPRPQARPGGQTRHVS